MSKPSLTWRLWAARTAYLALVICCFAFGQQAARALAAKWDIMFALFLIGAIAAALLVEMRLRRFLKANSKHGEAGLDH